MPTIVETDAQNGSGVERRQYLLDVDTSVGFLQSIKERAAQHVGLIAIVVVAIAAVLVCIQKANDFHRYSFLV